MNESNKGFAELIERRLPKRDIVTSAEVASAFDVGRSMVQGWCESGRLTAVVYEAPPPRTVYRATRAAVLELARKMEEGV